MSKTKRKISKVKKWFGVKKMLISTFLLMMFNNLFIMTALATQTTTTPQTAEEKWDAVIGFLTPWITRLGGAVMLIGAVMFGLGFKDNDAESKTAGLRTVIAGAIVFAVGLSSDIFLA